MLHRCYHVYNNYMQFVQHTYSNVMIMSLGQSNHCERGTGQMGEWQTDTAENTQRIQCITVQYNLY